MINDTMMDSDLKQYWLLLRQWLWLIVLAALLAGTSSYIVSRWFVEPVYQASTTLLIQPSNAYGTTEYADIMAGQRAAATYAEIVRSRPMRENALEALGYDITDQEAFREQRIAFDLTVQPLRDTQLIEIMVESPNRSFTRDYANALGQVFMASNEARQAERFQATQQEILDQMSEASAELTELQAELSETEDTVQQGRLELRIAQLENVLARYSTAYQQVSLSKLESTDLISVVEPAELPLYPVRPRTLMNTVLASIIGTMIAIGMVFLLEYLDTTVKSPDEISALTASPVLGQIWLEKGISGTNGQGAKIVQQKPLSLTSEAFRLLRANLQFASVDRPVQVLLISSSGPTEGKSTITLNLGLALALTGQQVIIIDADMRKPRQHHYADIDREPGLSDALVDDEIDAGAYLKPLPENPSVQIMPAGQIPPNPAELLGSQRMGDLLKACARMADIVIVDSPPLLAAADAAVLSTHTDGVLLVIEPGGTDRKAVVQAKEQLERTGARLLGTVLNKVPTQGKGSYYYSYYYYYSDEDPQKWWQRVLPGGSPKRSRRKEKPGSVTGNIR
jgi:non-specific protein-tyrosine kinase